MYFKQPCSGFHFLTKVDQKPSNSEKSEGLQTEPWDTPNLFFDIKGLALMRVVNIIYGRSYPINNSP